MRRLAGCGVLLSTFLPPPERSSSALNCSRFRRWYSTSDNKYWQYPMIATRCDNDGCNAGNPPTNGCPMPGSWQAPSGIGWQGCVLNETLHGAKIDEDECLEENCPWDKGTITGSTQQCDGDQDTCLLIIYEVEARGGRYLEQQMRGQVAEGFCIKNGEEDLYCGYNNQDLVATGDGDGDGAVDGDTDELVATKLVACKKFPQDDPQWTGMNCDPICETAQMFAGGTYDKHAEVVCHVENSGKQCKTPAPTPLPERSHKITATVRIDGYSMFCLLENYEVMMSSCAEEYPAPTFTELVQNSFLLAMKRRFRNSTSECDTLHGRVWDDQRTAHCQSKPQPARRPPTGSLSVWLGGHWNPDLHIWPSAEQVTFPRQKATEYDVELFKHHIRQGTIVDVQASYDCYETRQGEYSLTTVQKGCEKGHCSVVYGADWPWEKRTRPWYKCQCTCPDPNVTGSKQFNFAAPLSRGDNGRAFVEFAFEVHVSDDPKKTGRDMEIVRDSINNFENAGIYGPTMTDEFRRQLILDYFDQPADLKVTVIRSAVVTECTGSIGTPEIEGYCIEDEINAVQRGAAVSSAMSGGLVLLATAALAWQPRRLPVAYSQGLC